MARRKVTGDGYADQGRYFTRATGAASSSDGSTDSETVLVEGSELGPPSSALRKLAHHDDGWLRVVSHDQGATLFFKFKFSRGDYANTYVFWRCTDGDITGSLWGLLHKVELVKAGQLRPTPDTPYD